MTSSPPNFSTGDKHGETQVRVMVRIKPLDTLPRQNRGASEAPTDPPLVVDKVNRRKPLGV